MIALTTLFLILACTASQPDRLVHYVSVSVQPYQVQIGDPVEITITVRALGANSIKLEPLPENRSDLAISSSLILNQVDLLGAKVLTKTYHCIPFQVGDIEIPALGLEIIDPLGNITASETPPALIVVRTIAPEDTPTAIMELKSVIAPMENEDTFWPWIIAAAVVIAIAVVAWFYFRKRVPSSVQSLLVYTPAERALSELERLLSSKMLAGGEYTPGQGRQSA